MKRFYHCLATGLACLIVLSAAGSARADDGGEPDADSSRKPALRVSGAITEEPPVRDLKLIPPFVRDRQGDVTRTAVFPFYFHRTTPDSVERLVVPYYYQRGPKLNADVALGIWWWLRGPDRNTVVLPPVYTHRSGKDWAFGIPPLIMTGIFSGHHHTIIPPLLTWIDGKGKDRHTIIGPYFEWKSERKLWRGLFPLVWHKSDDVDRFTGVPPFYFRFADDDPMKYTTIVPPFYHSREKDLERWGLVPLMFRKKTPEANSFTIPLTLFHYAKGPETFRFVTPVFAYADTKENGRTIITPLYQNRRGDRNFDGVMPFFYRGWDNRDASKALVIAPIYWNFSDPANDATVVLPFFGRWFHEGIDRTWVTPLVGHYKSFEKEAHTWWVAPTFHLGWTEDSWQFNIHPLFYLKRAPTKRHLALAPLYFDFENDEEKTHRRIVAALWWDFSNGTKQKQSKVAFPLYWDFENRRKDKRTTVAFPLWFHTERGARTRNFVLNTFHERKTDAKGQHWQFHLFPLFSVGGGDNEKWWKLFYGLAGYERRGNYRRGHAFYVPFNVGK